MNFADVEKMLHHLADWHVQRAKGIGGSDAVKIMKGEWGELWDQKTGASEGENLDEILAVQMGSFTERLNGYWFQKRTGKEISLDNCDHIVHPKQQFMRANLDGWVHADNAVFEAKHVGAFRADGEVIDSYYPQLQHCMAVVGADRAYLSVFFGNNRWSMFDIVANLEYQRDLIAHEAKFWGHVERLVRPETAEIELLHIPPLDGMREVDMTGNNAWAMGAADYLANKGAAKLFEDSKLAIKELIELDVKLAEGHGIKVTRSKAGALTIRIPKNYKPKD